jgi:hypothetical protein
VAGRRSRRHGGHRRRRVLQIHPRIGLPGDASLCMGRKFELAWEDVHSFAEEMEKALEGLDISEQSLNFETIETLIRRHPPLSGSYGPVLRSPVARRQEFSMDVRGSRSCISLDMSRSLRSLRRSSPVSVCRGTKYRCWKAQSLGWKCFQGMCEAQEAGSFRLFEHRIHRAHSQGRQSDSLRTLRVYVGLGVRVSATGISKP